MSVGTTIRTVLYNTDDKVAVVPDGDGWTLPNRMVTDADYARRGKSDEQHARLLCAQRAIREGVGVVVQTSTLLRVQEGVYIAPVRVGPDNGTWVDWEELLAGGCPNLKAIHTKLHRHKPIKKVRL